MVQSVSEAPSSNGAAPLPDYVEIRGAPRFSANELRQIQAVTGLSMEKIMGNGADVIQAFVYVALRKRGFSPSWDEAGDVAVSFVEEVADPT